MVDGVVPQAFPPSGLHHDATSDTQPAQSASVPSSALPATLSPDGGHDEADTEDPDAGQLARAAWVEVARSTPFIALYGASGWHPVLLACRSALLVLRLAALASALLGRRSHPFPPAVRSLSARAGRALSRGMTLLMMELLMVAVLVLPPKFEDHSQCEEGLGERFCFAFAVDVFQTLMVVLWRSLGACWANGATKPGSATIPVEVLLYDQHVDGGPGRGEAGEVCVICFCGFLRGAAAARLPCGHIFHEACIRQWIQRNPSCPFRCQLAVTVGRPCEGQSAAATTAL